MKLVAAMAAYIAEKCRKSPEGSTEQMSWNVTFFMQSCLVHEVWGQKDHPSGLDRNTVQSLALSFHITGHHAPTRASFLFKTRQEDFLYDTKSS